MTDRARQLAIHFYEVEQGHGPGAFDLLSDTEQRKRFLVARDWTVNHG